ncbi:MAG TPA: dipeptidase [Paenirhodobacter sp.]
MARTPYFDGHNDTLLRLWTHHRATAEQAFIHGTPEGHLDLPKARLGGLGGGLCAIFVMPDPARRDDPGLPRVAEAPALRDTAQMLAILLRLARDYPQDLRLCLAVQDIEAAFANGQFAAVAHIEGAEMIGPDLDALYMLHAAGLRSLGPVWSHPNIFAHGVPFAFPSTPDHGPGLTPAGVDLVRACNELWVMIDLSHLNEAGFWDIARLSNAPLVATHSNTIAVAPHSRNLTDCQLDAIGASGGLVGINLGAGFLNPAGIRDAGIGLDPIRRHIDHIVNRIGLDHVALGSDFDGTLIPDDLRGAQDLPKITALLRADYTPEEIARFAHRNWFRVLRATWGG